MTEENTPETNKENQSIDLTAELVPTYFYSQNYTYRWSNGPTINRLDPYTRQPIKSLERAKELAEEHKVISYDKNHCSTHYGIIYTG